MEIGLLKEVIAVIRTEDARRASLPVEGPDTAMYEESRHGSFVNELCLMLLVTLRHEVERELVGLAARAADDGKEISGKRYQENERELRVGKGWDWKKISEKLSIKSCQRHTCMEALRHLANSCKHDPSMKPDENLLNLLNLTRRNYASLPDSLELQQALAGFVGLDKYAAYCEIAERFVDIASAFLQEVRSRTKVSPVEWGPLTWNDIEV
jgi:hypothetical protein